MAQTKEFRGVETTIIREDGNYKGIYRGTVVVEWNDKTITLNSNGWRTNTTKRRMNQASYQFDLGFTVYQHDFEWYVMLPNADTVEFEDGMTFEQGD